MWTQTYGEVFKSLLVYLKASCYFIHKWKVFSKNFFKKVFSQYFFSFCPFVLWISLAFWGELILQVFDFLDFCCNHFFIFNIYNAVGQQVDQKLNILLLFLKKFLIRPNWLNVSSFTPWKTPIDSILFIWCV